MNGLESLIRFHQRHRWWAHGLYWLTVLLVSVSSSKYFDGKAGSYGFELVTDALYMVPEMIEAYVLAYFILPFYFYRKQYLSSAVAFLAISYLTCALSRIFIVKICEPLAHIQPEPFETWANLLTDIPKLSYVYFFQILSVAFVFLIIKVVKDQLQIRQRTLLLEREKAETELKLLKAQLNPHFLFNTLNNIYSLSLTEPARTPESIARLADILDHILYRSHDNFVPLSAEVTLVKNYIQLEKLRYDHRLTVTFDCKIDRDVPIAPLLLLSLVENAFKHGASNDAGAPFIAMSLRVADQTLVFEITNSTGNEIPPADPARPRTEGIGLSNLQRQLDHLYGKAHQFSAYRERDRFRVRLVIDIQQETNSHEKVAVSAGR